MNSTSVLEQRRSGHRVPEVRDLLVLWQHPDTREIVPIGRFRYDGAIYSFRYTRAAAGINDFRPLPCLDDLARDYRSERLPAVFEQRVMEPDRPDYAAYLTDIGLDPAYATPWEQIVHSGGRRAGDTLQFMQIPTVVEGRAHARFLVNGIRHVPEEEHLVGGRTVSVTLQGQEAALRGLTVGDAVLLEPEHDNLVDPLAIMVTVGGTPVGWVPRALTGSLRELMGSGSLPATVVRVGAPGAPSHVRLALDLDVPAPAGFQFDRERRWEPLVSQ